MQFSAPLSPLLATGETMDPHDSYHFEINGEEAELRLKQFRVRCYLTRYSAQHRQYILSVYQPVMRGNEVKYETKHIVINFHHGDEKTYQVTDRQFNSLDEMLQTYEREMLGHSLPNIGRMVSEAQYWHQLNQQEVPPLTPEEFLQQAIDLPPIIGPPNRRKCLIL